MAEKDGKTTQTKSNQQAAAQSQPQSQPQAQPGQQQQTVSTRPQRPPAQHVLGEVAWLMSQSKTHKHFRMEDLSWFAMPPITLEQYRIFLGRQTNPENPQQQAEVPMGVAFWAMFSKEAERRFVDAIKAGTGPVQIKPKDWNSGTRLWLIEMVAPFATDENQQIKFMMDDFLKNGLLRAFQTAKDQKVKFFQTDKDSGERKIIELQAQFSQEGGAPAAQAAPKAAPQAANDGGDAKG